MDKYPLIGVSICAVVLLVLGSLTNVVGYQTVQSSNQSIIKERINQKELLFQTIVDITNNKEIQQIILKSQMNRGIFPVSDIPVLTKNQLKQMYLTGLMLSKIINKSKTHSMIQRYQLTNQVMQKEISTVIEKDAKLKEEMTQLLNSKCDCDENNIQGNFRTITCRILELVFYAVSIILDFTLIFIPYLLLIDLCLIIIGEISFFVAEWFLFCDWATPIFLQKRVYQ